MNAYKTLNQTEYDKIWGSFYEKFNFRLSIDREKFPSILEPTPSITYAISEGFGDDSKIRDLNDKILSSPRSQLSEGERMYVLDWQHECSWFYPHRNFQDWMVPVLPKRRLPHLSCA